MNYLPELLTIATLHFLALISPGPDFAIVIKNSLVYSKRAGIYSAIGIALGLAIHVTYSLIGIGLIISKSIIVFSILKLLGAGYLIYLGIKILASKDNIRKIKPRIKLKDISKFEAFKQGFFTNVLNPKVTLFFLSIFTLVINPSTPFWVKLIYGVEMTTVTFLWFTFVSLMMSQNKIKNIFVGLQNYIEKVMGAILVLIGVKVALSK